MPISQCPLQQLMTFKIRPEPEDLQPGFAPPSVAPLDYPLRTSAQHAPAYLRLGHVSPEHISFHATLCPSRHSGFPQAQSVNANSNQVKVLESRSRGYGDPGPHHRRRRRRHRCHHASHGLPSASGFWLLANSPALRQCPPPNHNHHTTTTTKKKKKRPGL